MQRQVAGIRSSRRQLFIVVLAFLVGVLSVIMLQPGFQGSGGDGAAAQLAAERPVMQVHPPVVKLPERGGRGNGGVWLLGSGLQPGQEFLIRVRWGTAQLESDLTASLIGWDEEEFSARANFHGAFSLGLFDGLNDMREGRDHLFQGSYDAVTIRLVDADTMELLAIAPLGVCGPDRAEALCNAAEDLKPME